MEQPYDIHPATRTSAPVATYDPGLRRHMLGIYNTMALGLAIAGVVAVGGGAPPALSRPLFNTPHKLVALFGPQAFVFFHLVAHRTAELCIGANRLLRLRGGTRRRRNRPGPGRRSLGRRRDRRTSFGSRDVRVQSG